MLVYTVYTTVDVPKKKDSGVGKLAAMAVGLAVLACHLVGAPFTGPSLNPARSFVSLKKIVSRNPNLTRPP